MKTITVGFSKSLKKMAFGSLAIRIWMRTDYSHVYLKFYSQSLGRTLIYEAVGSGVRFIGQPAWEGHAKEMHSYDIEISDEAYFVLMGFCVDNAGIEYGFLQNLGVVISDLLKLEKNIFREGANCSEIVGKVLIMEGFAIDKSIDLVIPRDIKELLDNNPSRAVKK